jgi:hypothetical protein
MLFLEQSQSMTRAILITILALSPGIASAADCVVLLHGLIRSSWSMEPMAEALIKEGFEAVNINYPSRDLPIEELAPIAVGDGLNACRGIDGVDRIHFVTHSLGGILLRQYLSELEIPELGRVVMLGPPNKGTDAVDKLGDMPGFDWLNGPAGRQVGKGDASVPLRLGPADFELGIIAGNRTIDPLTSAVLEDPDDGRVSVEDTKLEGMKEHVVVEHSHAFMMRMRRTIELTIRFLKTGSFAGA